MNLLVVLPYCGKDRHTAVALLQWIDHLGGCYENDLLLIGSNDVERPDLNISMFRSFEFIQPAFKLPNESHPVGPNRMFETALLHMVRRKETRPFLWLEPDCVPLRKWWLKDIEKEYAEALKAKKEILASIIVLNDSRFPPRIPSGVAVYPADAWKVYSRLQTNRKIAWDIQFANDAIKLTKPSESIVSRLNHNQTPTFVERRVKTSPENAMTIDRIPSKAALFHPNKDGTLIELLRDRMPAKPEVKLPPKPKPFVEPVLVPHDPLQQPAPYDCRGPEKWSVAEFMGTVPLITAPKSPVPTSPRRNRIIHCVQRWKPNDAQIDRRIHNAVKSWIQLYMTGEVVPCHVWEPFVRDARGLGDARALPYLRDILNAGLKMAANDSDIILLTNDDSLLHPDLSTVLFERLEKKNCLCAGRLNFKGHHSLNVIKESQMGIESDDIGRDAFAFKAKWLAKNFDSIPDMLLGEAQFDIVLASLIRKANGVPVTLESRRRAAEKCELKFGWVQHEEHERGWMMGPTPAQKHNLMLAAQWYEQNNLKAMIDFDPEGKA